METHARPVRRRPPWWLVALVQLAGAWAASALFVVAVLSLPRTGLFSVANDDGTRLTGALAALGFGPAATSGPILVGLVRRDARWLGTSLAVAAVLSTVLAIGAAGL